MIRALELGTLWRILRETDLGAIKREAEQAFRLLIVASDPAEAERLARLLSGADARVVHPWLSVHQPPVSAETLRELGQVDAAILLSSSSDLPGPLQASWAMLAEAGVPVVTVVAGVDGRRPGAVGPHPGEAARIAVASLTAEAVAREVGPALLQAVSPSLRLALGRQLPPLRPALFERLISETARANATYSFSTGLGEIIPVLNIPLTIGDVIVLTKNQLVMGYKIALVAGKQGEPRELLGEVAGVLGGGFLFRQIARELVGLIPVAGIVPKVAVAYAGTWAIGRAVTLWATEGRAVSAQTLRQFYAEALERGRRVAEALVEGARRARRPQQANPGERPERSAERLGLWQRLRRRLPF